jgi:acyl-CoA reductase-like NAD-dependent aldehyde dehydrogenase
MNHRAKNYFSHQWQNGSGNIGISHDPATWQPVAEYSCATTAEFETGVSAARHAFDCGTWPHQPRLRAEILYEFAELLQARSREIEPVLVQLNGKLIKEARGEIGAAISELKYYAGLARNLWGRVAEIDSGCYSMIAREGAGVVGIIVPWNAPVTLLIRSLAPALAAGCTAVLKVAHQTSLVHQMVLECLTDISSLPQDIVCSFVEDGSDISKRMCEHPLIDVISFTGSSQTGKKIAASSSGTLKRLSLELGGKAPAIVLSDVKVDAAVNQLVAGALPMAGQQCTAIARILIDNTRFDEVSQRLVSALSAIKLGPGADLNSQMGPLIDIANRDRIARLIDSAKTQGKVHLEGRVPSGVLSKGAFVTPTLVEIEDLNSSFVQDEIFGPFIVIERFNSSDEAIERANATRFGLAASVWGENREHARKLASKLKSGTVWLNCHNRLFAEAETGGYRESGYGRLHGLQGLEDFMSTKHVYWEDH